MKNLDEIFGITFGANKLNRYLNDKMDEKFLKKSKISKEDLLKGKNKIFEKYGSQDDERYHKQYSDLVNKYKTGDPSKRQLENHHDNKKLVASTIGGVALVLNIGVIVGIYNLIKTINRKLEQKRYKEEKIKNSNIEANKKAELIKKIEKDKLLLKKKELQLKMKMVEDGSISDKEKTTESIKNLQTRSKKVNKKLKQL